MTQARRARWNCCSRSFNILVESKNKNEGWYCRIRQMQILKDISKPTQCVPMMTDRQYLFWKHFFVRMEESTLREKNKSLLWSLTLRKRYKKKPIIGLITDFFAGGDGGIRTLVPQGASWFRVMSVMTTSIRLRILVIYLVYFTCFLCDCQAKLHKFVNFKFNP